ncbi:cytochrome c oxidase subunit 5A, mitochondrial-like [Watersipora subatra]|uniref:cytochrome c oxidase subunit 5A, mitochondrial-like n=1 Tax=Watersipora subatra TaxID=2589382 RepID=UPI00355C2D72
MIRSFLSRAIVAANNTTTNICTRNIASTSQRLSKQDTRTDDEIDHEIISYLERKDIDSWQLRKTLQTIHTRDAIPDPNIITAVVKACRLQNDFALAVRFLETVQLKCGPHKQVVWPWLVQQVKPTLDELGIPTPEEMGYDKPELYKEDVMDM